MGKDTWHAHQHTYHTHTHKHRGGRKKEKKRRERGQGRVKTWTNKEIYVRNLSFTGLSGAGYLYISACLRHVYTNRQDVCPKDYLQLQATAPNCQGLKFLLSHAVLWLERKGDSWVLGKAAYMEVYPVQVLCTLGLPECCVKQPTPRFFPV